MRTSAEMERIRNNILKIMTGFHWITPIYNTTDQWNWRKANRWEQILNEIYNMMFGMEDWYVYSGVARSGQPRLWQHRFRDRFEVPDITERIELEYIESTETQYIDSLIRAQAGVRIVTKVAMTSDAITSVLFGTHYNPLPISVLFYASTKRWGSVIAGTVYNTTFYSELYDIRTIELNVGASTQTVKINGRTIITANKEITSIGGNIHIFRRSSSSANGSYMRLYESQIYLNDELVRDFVPVLDGNNVPCLYDKITGSYFYNRGTGTFLYGEKEANTMTYNTLNLKSNLKTQNTGELVGLGDKADSTIIVDELDIVPDEPEERSGDNI